MKDAPNMRWTEIQAQWQAAAMEFRGILEDYHTSPPELESVKDEHLSPEVHSHEVHSHEVHSPEPHAIQLPAAPLQEKKAAHTNLAKGTNLSDRFRAVEDKKRTWTQLSESESEYEESEEEVDGSEEESEEEQEESEEESEEEQEESEEDNDSLFCMRLRSGTTLKN